MELKKNISHKLTRIGEKARRIFKITYEDLTAQIFYEPQHTFMLQLCRDYPCREEILLEREITRGQAFHMMNTRNESISIPG